MLTAKREKFAQGVASGMQAADAYRDAYDVKNMATETIWKRSSELYRNGSVRGRIDELRALENKGTEKLFSLSRAEAAALVLEHDLRIVSADPSTLIRHRRLNCRFCHGKGHEYRWRDEAEFWGELARVSDVIEKWDAKRGNSPELPTEAGGFGFKRLAPPAADCPQCEGEGVEDTYVADIASLRGPERVLYAGMKVKKDGSIEVLMQDRNASLQRLARYGGVIDDTVKVNALVGVVPLPALTPEQIAEVAKRLASDI